MSVDEQTIRQNKRKKRKDDQPGIIDLFLANSNEAILSIKLYSREIRRLERQYPEISISKDNRFNNTDLWECTISKK